MLQSQNFNTCQKIAQKLSIALKLNVVIWLKRSLLSTARVREEGQGVAKKYQIFVFLTTFNSEILTKTIAFAYFYNKFRRKIFLPIQNKSLITKIQENNF